MSMTGACKIHLALALARKAIRQNYSILFAEVREAVENKVSSSCRHRSSS
jgi:DNA replication protein DnaC